MNDISYFESRQGTVTCTAEEVFTFVTDIRNFEQFIPQGTIKNWHAEKESADLSVSMLGTVTFRLSEKKMFNKVVFKGDALKKNDFSLLVHITENGSNPAQVKVSLEADLNPTLKMMAAKPIAQFLDILVNEMEKFTGWKDIKG